MNFILKTFIFSLAVGLVGCVGNNTTSSNNQVKNYAYAANQISHSISMYVVESNGTLNPLQTASIDSNPNSSDDELVDMILSPNRSFAYVANRSTNLATNPDNLATFKINKQSGLLTWLADVPIGPGPKGLVFNPAGTCLYITSTDNNTVSAFHYNSITGNLTPETTVSAGLSAGQLMFTPNGKFAYVARIPAPASDQNTLYMYSTNPNNCDLTPLSPAFINTSIPNPPSYGPSSVTIDPTGKYIYVTNLWTSAVGGDGSTITQFQINQNNGLLTPLAPDYIQAGFGPKALAFAPNQPFAYIINQGYNSGGSTYGIANYNFDSSNGQLTFESYTGTNEYFDGTLDIQSINYNGESSSYIYLTNNESGNIFTFKINPTNGALNIVGGAIDITSGSSQSLQGNLNGLVFSSNNQHAYIANTVENTVVMYNVDQETGQLTSLGDVSAGNQPISILLTNYNQ